MAYQEILVKELAALSGISKHTLDNYLNLRGHIPSADIAVKIAHALGVSVEYLVTGEENSPKKSSLDPEIQTLVQDFKTLDGKDRKMIYAIVQLFKNQRKG
ncbi:helix-turn-helix domain-containing protein [Treponema primitia]|uniref:helix-turn-helix domain-containing protein n=1 Tax=Treponema primitia TaxID=88058 RepID=UPI001E5A1144|nr:helix-turn-helix domain-containing protein [Treponema primitia]